MPASGVPCFGGAAHLSLDLAKTFLERQMREYAVPIVRAGCGDDSSAPNHSVFNKAGKKSNYSIPNQTILIPATKSPT